VSFVALRLAYALVATGWGASAPVLADILACCCKTSIRHMSYKLDMEIGEYLGGFVKSSSIWCRGSC